MNPMKVPPAMTEAAAQVRDLLRDAMLMPRRWGAEGLGTARIEERFFEIQPARLRLSHGALCDRRHWYERHEPETSLPADGSTRIKFAFGDTLEALMLSSFGGHLEQLNGPWRLDPEWAQRALARTVCGEEVRGHPDGLLTWDGMPYAIIDSKNTAIWSWKRWEDGRRPDATWGYRHQAANYIAASGDPRIRGFLWLTGVLDNNNIKEYGVGWMTAEELAPYAADAERTYSIAITSTVPPLPVVPGRDAVPCRSKQSVYCRHYDHCIKDPRNV